MILNRGLDAFMTVVPTNAGTDFYAAFRNYMALGTGSGEPTATQTALVAEVLRGSSSGGLASTVATSVDAANNRVIGTFGITRVYDFTASYNLTEVGFSDVASGTVNTRDLFRDGSGNAITIPVQSGQQLQMTHSLRIALPYSANLASTTDITGLGVLPGKSTFFAATPSLIFQNIFLPASSNGQIYIRPMTTANTGSETALGGSTANGSTNSPNAAMDAYVTGSYKRTKTAVFTTAMANISTYGWVWGNLTPGDNNSISNGYKISLTTPFTKSSLNKLTLVWELSIARGITP